jgi:tetratricopeptide (TPR) repeat protein
MKWRQGLLDEALRAIDAAIALDPLTALSHEILALTLSSMGRIEEAATAFRRALELEPSFLNAYYELAILYLGDGRGEQAGGVFAEWGAAVGYPEAEGLTIIGEALADPAVLPEAIRRAEAFFDYSGRGRTNPALLAHLGETERAIESFREVLLQRGSLASTGGTFLFRPLWNHPEFRAMHAETNLPLPN